MLKRTLLACALAWPLAAIAVGGQAHHGAPQRPDPAQVAQFVRMAAAQHITAADVKVAPSGALVATGLETCIYVQSVVGCGPPSIEGLELRSADGRVFRQY